MTATKEIKVGTRVYTNLYARGKGIVYKIHGEQKSGTIVMGGRASFDIVFLSGEMSSRLPESILRGIQWEILDDKEADAGEITNALQNAAMRQAEEVIKKAQEEVKFNAEVSALKANPDYKHLQVIEEKDKYATKFVAANIRRDLKKNFPNIKFFVRSDCSSVRVFYPLNALAKADQTMLEDILYQYKTGYFNEMTDCYESRRSPWNKVFGGVSYVFFREDWK